MENISVPKNYKAVMAQPFLRGIIDSEVETAITFTMNKLVLGRQITTEERDKIVQDYRELCDEFDKAMTAIGEQVLILVKEDDDSR